MKASNIAVHFSCEEALYPTWFRWKEKRKSLQGLGKSLYIPHGSDESGSLV